MSTRIEDLKRRLRQIEEQAASGTLRPDQAATAKAPLQQELLTLVMESDEPPPAAPRASRRMLAGITVLVLVIAVAGYARFGTPAAWKGVPVASSEEGAGQGNASAQIDAMVKQLEERLKTQPDDADGWSMLGRSYSALGRYPEAVTVFERVVGLRPKDAQGYADLADAKAMAAGRKLEGEPTQLIAKALQLDPKNLKALALAGTIAFNDKEFARAARLWEAAVAVAEPGSELVRNLEGGIAEARSRAGLPAANPPAAAAAASAAVSGRVQLAASLKGRVSPEDTLFVFARAVQGPKMPLAILRKQVKDLPLDFTLDDSLAMSPAAKLSGAAQVIVGARVSMSGNALPQPGDLQGLSPAVVPGTSGLSIEITEELK